MFRINKNLRLQSFSVKWYYFVLGWHTWKKYHITVCSYLAGAIDLVIAKKDQGFGCGTLIAQKPICLCLRFSSNFCGVLLLRVDLHFAQSVENISGFVLWTLKDGTRIVETRLFTDSEGFFRWWPQSQTRQETFHFTLKYVARSGENASFCVLVHSFMWRKLSLVWYCPAVKKFVFGFAALSLPFIGSAADANPVNKEIQPPTNLESKIKVEGVEAHNVHEEFTAWCNTQSSDLTFYVKTGQNEKADLEANLVQLGASSETLQTKVDDLARSAATSSHFRESAGNLSQCSHTKESRVKKHFPTEKAFPQDINQFEEKSNIWNLEARM